MENIEEDLQKVIDYVNLSKVFREIELSEWFIFKNYPRFNGVKYMVNPFDESVYSKNITTFDSINYYNGSKNYEERINI